MYEKESTGKFYVSVVVETKDIEVAKLEPTSIVGIDLGIKDLAICSDGYAYKKINKSEYFKAINQQKNLESVIENPYFGRLDIEYKEDNEKETIYIGRRRVDIGDDVIVYSWAAPIADIYQEYNSGEYKRKYIDKNSGKEIFLEGNILEIKLNFYK